MAFQFPAQPAAIRTSKTTFFDDKEVVDET